MEDRDIYDEEEIDELLESDEISGREEAFMNGYAKDESLTNENDEDDEDNNSGDDR